MDPMNPTRRSLCIVSREPLQCSELVLSLQASLAPDDEVEIIMDRRRDQNVLDTRAAEPNRGLGDRRQNHHVELEVKTKGFAIVPAAQLTPRSVTEPDAADRARFENILSFKRRREPRPRWVVGAAGAVMVALILSPTLSGLSERVPIDAPSSSGTTKSEPSPAAARPGPAQPAGGTTHAPIVSGPSSTAPVSGNESASGNASRARANSPGSRTIGARGQHPKHGKIEKYAERVEDATGRIVSKAKGLIDRVKSEVIGNAPISIGREPPSDDDPVAVTPRPAQTP